VTAVAAGLQSSDGFWSALSKLVNERHIVRDPEALLAFCKDETPFLPPGHACAAVFAQSTEQVSAIVRLCAEHGVGITPRGAGTGKSGGAVPVSNSLVLSLQPMNRILHIDTQNLSAHVEAGVVLGDLQNAVAARGLYYPPDPASFRWCTIGGNVAENASGPSSVKYGCTRDYVLGLKCVLASGDIVWCGKHTTKGVTGYDLTSLICGSEGTLALVTEVLLRLLPRPAARATSLMGFASAKQAIDATCALLGGGILPVCIELMDQGTLKALVRSGMSPPFKLDPIAAALLVECDGDTDAAVHEVMVRLASVAERAGACEVLVAQSEAERRAFWSLRHSLSEATRRLAKHKVSEDIVVPRAQLAEMVAYLKSLGERHGLQTCAFGHVGDGNVHAQVLFDDASDQPRVEALLDELFRKTVELGGTLTGEHGVGLAKMPYLALEQSNELLLLQQRLKAAFDPKGTLNPGKFLPS